MRLIAPSEYRRMPWKNGGGTTFEVAVHPAGADWTSFVWRISIAEVASSGPFSSLPGIDRSLVVLAGGMVLTGARAEPIEAHPFDCVAFAGEAQVRSRLLDGPTRDCNVMTRRGSARADVRIVQDGSMELNGATTYVCHAATKACACHVGGTTIEVPEAHTLVAEGARLDVDAANGAVAVVALVTH